MSGVTPPIAYGCTGFAEVKSDGTTEGTGAHGIISATSKLSSGKYQITLSRAQPATAFPACVMPKASGGGNAVLMVGFNIVSTTVFEVWFKNDTNTLADTAFLVSVFDTPKP